MSDKFKGLYQQLKDSGRVMPYSTGSFSLDSLTEVLEEWELERYRQLVQGMIQHGIQAGKITLTERIQLEELISSPDRENIYMAEQIAKFKIEQI